MNLVQLFRCLFQGIFFSKVKIITLTLLPRNFKSLYKSGQNESTWLSILFILSYLQNIILQSSPSNSEKGIKKLNTQTNNRETINY